MEDKKTGAVRQLLDYAGDCKGKLYMSSFLAMAGEILGMVPFFVVAVLIREIYLQTVTMRSLIILFFISLTGQLCKVFFTYVSTIMSHKATYHILKNIRTLIADKMQRVPLGVVLDTTAGTWKNLMVDTVSKLEDPMAHFMHEITSNIVAPVCCLIVIFALDWRMGLASLITIPLGALG